MPPKTPIQKPEVWEPGYTPERRKFRFLHNAHRFTLFRRARSPYWYVKFALNRSQIATSLQTIDVKLAKARAISHYQQQQAALWDPNPQPASPAPPPRPYAKIGAILDLYAEGIYHVNPEITPRTVRANASALRRLLEMCKGPTASVRELPCTELTEALLIDFRARYLEPAGSNVRARESRKRGGASMVRQARSLFSETAMRLYSNLRLPDLTSFRRGRIFDAKAALVVETPAETIAAIATAARALRDTNHALYLAHLCYRHLGMRNIEISAARWSWITTRPGGGGLMVIDQTAEFDPKGSLGRVPISADVLAELATIRARLGADASNYIIPAADKTARNEIVYRDHSEWIKAFLDNSSSKTSYRLRKWAGDTMRAKYGDDASRTFLRHADSSVAGKHYWSAFDWDRLATRCGEAPGTVGITFADCGVAM